MLRSLRSLFSKFASTLVSENPVDLLVDVTILLVTLGAVIAFSSSAFAGFVEVGGSFSYKKSTIDETAYEQSQSVTASLTYYFDESSALELSYTDGYTKQFSGDSMNGMSTTMFFGLVGLDFIYTFGTHDSMFRPYLKAGTNYLSDRRVVTQGLINGTWGEARAVTEAPTFVPSAGAGFRISLTPTISLKIGVDAWTSGAVSEKPLNIDYAGRAGASYMF